MMRPALDLSLYLVTDTAMSAARGLGATVRAAVLGGVTVVQLREGDPGASDADVVDLGRQVRRALEGTGVPLLVNDRVHLAAAIGADGAHVGQGDLAPEAARAMLGEEAYLGLSCTTLEQVRAAGELPPGTLDYLGLGPVWPTPTKTDHATPLGTGGLADLVTATSLPTVAIGGINGDRLADVLATGVDGVAVVSAICASADPEQAARSLLAASGAHR